MVAAGLLFDLFISTFTDDVAAIADRLGTGRRVVGGITIGAITGAVVRSLTYSSICRTVAGSVAPPTSGQ